MMENMATYESPAKNVIYIEDSNYSLQIIRWLLQPIGVWPLSNTASKSKRALSDILLLICSSLIAGMLIPCALSIFYELDDLQMKLKTVGPMNFWLMAAIKYFCLVIRSGGIRKCLVHVVHDWRKVGNATDREIMLRNARMGRYVVYFCLVCMHTGVFSYEIIKGTTLMIIMTGNETVRFRTVPYPFYNQIVNTTNSPSYEIIFALQCLSSFVVNSVNAGACGLATVLVMHACGQLQIIMSWLGTLLSEEQAPGRSVSRKLADIVEHHLRVLSFISDIEDIMHHICFVDLVICTMNICLLGYYSITVRMQMEWKDNDTKSMIACLVIFISLTFDIFIFCYIGEMLSEQCKQVGETAYMTEWYRLPKETALGFILIISRSRSVIKITAGKLIELSLSTFGSVMRTAMAYFNILWTMMI